MELQCSGRILIQSQYQSQKRHSVGGLGGQVEIYDGQSLHGTGVYFLFLFLATTGVHFDLRVMQ